MENLVYGDMAAEGLEVVERDGRYFVRYDAGGLQSAWREDELSKEEFSRLRQGRAAEYKVLIEMQRRLASQGVNPNSQNWTPRAT